MGDSRVERLRQLHQEVAVGPCQGKTTTTAEWEPLLVERCYRRGASAEAIAKRGQISPGTSFLEKPFTRAELTRALQRLTIEPLVA